MSWPIIYNPSKEHRPEPTHADIQSLRRAAKRRGFFTDWYMIALHSDGELALIRVGEDNHTVGLMAVKENGRWKFHFEDECGEVV